MTKKETSKKKRFWGGLAIGLAVLLAAASGKPQEAKAAVAEEASIDEAHFPDEIFRTYVSNKFDSDKNGKLSAQEIAGVTGISVSYAKITNLKGLEYFTSLTSLNCSWNQLTELDVIAGVTKSDSKPIITKNRITDTSASKIVKASIRNAALKGTFPIFQFGLP